MVSCDVACHVTCDVIACVASCRVDAMRCHGDERLSVVPCNELKMPLVVRSVLLRTTTHYSSSTLCTTQYYSSTTLCYKVLLQNNTDQQSATTYYSSTTTTKRYSSSTLYYKIILQHKSVQQSTTPVLLYYTPLCTTKHSSSTIFHFLMRAARVPGGPGQFAFFFLLHAAKVRFSCEEDPEMGQFALQLAKHTQNGRVQKTVFKQQTFTSMAKPIQEKRMKSNNESENEITSARGPFRTQVIALLDSYEELQEGILCDVFSQKCSAAWQDARGERLVGYLHNARYSYGGNLRQVSKERRRVQAQHLWMVVNLTYITTSSRQCAPQPS